MGRTGYDKFFEAQMIDPAFAESYKKAVTELSMLEDNYDGDGAEAPNQDTISKTQVAAEWVTSKGFKPDVSPDAMGGTAVHFELSDGRLVWISNLNHGRSSMVVTQRGIITSCTLQDVTAEALDEALIVLGVRI